ncbi:MAG TPA: hypothetical protein VHR66_24885 [Gemmataceae bacterium]|nr:hypothetical protein [Gemmataceae bacterium]
MPRAPHELPTPEEERDLHRRLVERDPVAPSDLADAYLQHLVDWLRRKNLRSIPDDFITEAAGDALVSLMKRPESYRGDTELSLVAYLQMSASADLKNVLAKQQRWTARNISLAAVEVAPDGGKVLSVTDDPADQLVLEEDVELIRNEIMPALRDGLTAEELRCLDLLLECERSTEPYADVLGIGHLEIDEQRRLVKQVKDKLQRRITRGRSRHGESS